MLLVFTGGFATHIHTNGEYNTDDLDCKVYPLTDESGEVLKTNSRK